MKRVIPDREGIMIKSPPARGRGLKLMLHVKVSVWGRSPPARGRGLKLDELGRKDRATGRPLRGGVD